MRPMRSLLAFCSTAAVATAQSLLTVGPQGQFPDLPQAVAAARPGDTILCLLVPPLQVFTAPTVTKGVTILGDGHFVGGQITVAGIPAGQTFRLHGLAPLPGQPVSIAVRDCAGRVHLEFLRTNHTAPTLPLGPSIEVLRSTAVSLSQVNTFGAPALRAVDSVLTLSHCVFGAAAAAAPAGGRALDLDRCRVTVAQPTFDAGREPVSTIFAKDSNLRITGRWTVNGSGAIRAPILAGVQWPAIFGVGGSLVLGTQVALQGPVIGFGSVTMHDTPYQSVLPSQRGGVTQIDTYGPKGALGVVALSLTSRPILAPFGDVWLDPASAIAYFVTLDLSGRHWALLTVPASTPLGTTLTAQGLVLVGSTLELTSSVTFTIAK